LGNSRKYLAEAVPAAFIDDEACVEDRAFPGVAEEALARPETSFGGAATALNAVVGRGLKLASEDWSLVLLVLVQMLRLLPLLTLLLRDPPALPLVAAGRTRSDGVESEAFRCWKQQDKQVSISPWIEKFITSRTVRGIASADAEIGESCGIGIGSAGTSS